MNTTGHRPRRHVNVSGFVTFLLVAALLTGLAPAAAAVTARDITSACPPGQVPAAGFRDTAGSTFAFEIDCIVAYGVAEGTSRTTYSPGDTVTRGQMASFLARVLEAAGRTRPANLPDRFRDDDGTRHEANIDWLAFTGVVSGFADGTYRPSAPVTRAQMASFLSNVILDLDGRRPTSTTDHFWDDDGNHHEANINGLASEGITTGVGGTSFNPNGLVTRQQMAGFLARELDYLVDTGRVRSIGKVQDFAVVPRDAVSLPTSDVTTAALANRGARSYSATIPPGITSVNLALLPTSNIVIGSDGYARFTSTAPLPDNGGTGFEVINGSTIDIVNGTNDRAAVNGVAVPANRTLSFTVDSIVATAVTPIWYEDDVAPAADRLDLEAPASATSPQVPIERFGLGGAVTWRLPEPTIATNLPVGTVREVNLASSYYTLDVHGTSHPEFLIRFPSGDTFGYTAANGGPGSITRANFTAWLSVGDRVDPGAYRPGQTHHVITGDVPNAPMNVAASSAGGTEVRVTFTKPSNPVASLSTSSYRLQRAPVTGGVVGTYLEVASITGEKPAVFTNTPPAGTWAYRVVARSVTGDSPASPPATITTLAVPEPVIDTNPPVGTVREVNLAGSYYTLDVRGGVEPEYRIRFPAGDTFSYTAAGGGPGSISRTNFESWLSVGDRVDPGVYRPGQTLHVIVGDVSNAPTGVSATVVDGTAVRVTFVKPTNPVATLSTSSFRLQRAPVTGGVVGSFTEVANIAGNVTAEFTNTPAQGSWAYRVIARNTTGDSPPSNVVTATTGPSTTAPATTGSALQNNANTELDFNDRLVFTFDRPVTLQPGWRIDLVDDQGDVGRVSAATASAVVSGTSTNILTITLTSTPQLQGATVNGRIDTGTFLQVREVVGIGNAAGTWNLPKSGLAASPYLNTRVIIGRPATAAPPGGSLTAKVGTSTLIAGVNEIQNLKVTGATEGTYTLQTGTGPAMVVSDPIPFDASIAVIETTIAGMSGIETGNVQVTGDPYGTSGAEIRFVGALSAKDVPQLEPDVSQLDPAASVVVTTTTNGASVTGISAGDTLRVYSTAGVQLGAATAGTNGLTTVTLSQTVTTGQTIHVVVEKPSTKRFSLTAAITATP
jgi:hypothetical protein